jgi:hypothetical protein
VSAVVDINKLAEELMGVAKQFFVSNGYGAAPLVVMLIGDEDSILIAAPEGIPPGTLYDTMIQMIKSVGFTPNLICMVMDTYALKIDKDNPNDAWDQADSLRAGDLGRMFKAGRPDVVEQLMVEVLRSGEEVSIGLPYKYTPVDGWEWSEPVPMPPGTTSDWEFDRLVAGLPKKSYKEMAKERE